MTVYEGWDALKAIGGVLLIVFVFAVWFFSRMDGS